MTPRPYFTVVVPTFDGAPKLERAIASVLAQRIEDLELVVVDDGSRDATAEVVGAQSDPRVRYLQQEHRGVSAARNSGLRHARGEVVTFLDADDEAKSDWLSSLAAGFAEPGAGVVTAGVTVHARDEGSRVVLPRHLGPLFGHQRLCFFAGALAARRELLTAIGGYAESLGYAENEELALRLVPECLARGLSVVVIDRPLVVYHRDPRPWRCDPHRFALMREGAEYILQHHGERLRAHYSYGYANHLGVAAVNAARLGDYRAARRHLALALRARPRRFKNYLRWAITLVPPVAARVWARGQSLPT